MSYYIMYPKNPTRKVKIVTKRPQKTKGYGYAEGPMKTECEVFRWLNWKDVPNHRRPEKFQRLSLAEVCG